MTAVCMSAIFHLRNISTIRRYLTAAETMYVIHAFVTGRLDVGNALLYRLHVTQTQRLQKVQNWTARLIDGAMKYSCYTAADEVALAADNIEQWVSRRQPVRSLRSSEHSLLCVPGTRRHWGDRAFNVAAPCMWNALPQHLTLTTMSTAAFKVKLHAYLFSRTFCTAL